MVTRPAWAPTTILRLLYSGLRSSRDEWRGGERGSLYALLGRSFSAVSGLVLIAVAAAQLTPAAQGYFLTFLSILLLQILLELGFLQVLTQFVSHEAADLTFDSRGGVSGPPTVRARLGALIQLATRWYLALGIALLLLVGGGGYLFFHVAGDDGVAWQLPWILLVVAQVAYVQLIALNGILEGCGRVAASQRAVLSGNVVGVAVGCAALLAGAGLYSLALMVAARTVVAGPLLWTSARDLLALRTAAETGGGPDWRAKFWTQQRRIAMSWAAGFAMYQSFTPIAFAVQSPAVAGQVGVAAQAFLAVQYLGGAWVLAVHPRLGGLAAGSDLSGLRKLARETLSRSVATAVLTSVLGLTLLVAIKAVDPEYGARFGDLGSIALFFTAAIVLQASNVETAAVRFRKREPFVVVSFAGAVLVIGSNVLLGSLFGLPGMALGFVIIVSGILVPWTHRLYVRHTSS